MAKVTGHDWHVATGNLHNKCGISLALGTQRLQQGFKRLRTEESQEPPTPLTCTWYAHGTGWVVWCAMRVDLLVNSLRWHEGEEEGPANLVAPRHAVVLFASRSYVQAGQAKQQCPTAGITRL